MVIYHDFCQVHELPKRIDTLFNSQHKCVDNNEHVIRMINDILKMTDNIAEFIVPNRKCPIELEK